MARPIIEGDEYELLPILGDGHRLATVVDVGGHIGGFTIRVKSLWPQATVIAAEPDPEAAEMFRRNTGHLERIHFYHAAFVGDSRGREVRFCEAGSRPGSDGNSASSFVVETVDDLNPDHSRGMATCVVPAMPLSGVLRERGVSDVDLIKLDCEGSEAEILEDLRAAGFLSRVRWIRGEWHHFASIPRIERALAETHVCNVARNPYPWGYFIAHRRWGTDPGGG